MLRQPTHRARLPAGARLVNQRVWLWDLHGERSVYWKQRLLYRFPLDDVTQCRACAALLVEGRAATFKEVCQAFEICERTFCRVLRRFRQGGLAALAPGKTGPKSRRETTRSRTPDMIRLYVAGDSTYKIARQFGLSPSTVARVLKEAGCRLRSKRHGNSGRA